MRALDALPLLTLLACGGEPPPAQVVLASPPMGSTRPIAGAVTPNDDVSGCTHIALALVIDRSAAMKGDALQSARAGASALFDQAGEGDCISVVTFASDVQRVLGLTRAKSERGKRAIGGIVEATVWNGQVVPAVQTAWRLVRRTPSTAKRAILIISGAPSIDPDAATVARTIAADGVVISAAWLRIPGGGETTLRALADDGNGRYYTVGTLDSLPRVMQRELEMLAAPPTDVDPRE